ncbi:MAG: hypothetical protein H6817_04095 [Phycisphaerales bacterium]|nr:hypothetical protein [Phycisphaerales bacterium]
MRRRVVFAWLLVVALVVAASGCRSPQRRRDAVGGLELTDVGGYVEYVARDRRRDQSSKVGAGEIKSKETIFEENVQLETEGYLYHPNLVEFSAAGLFGLLQYKFEDEYDGTKRRSNEDGDVLEFDLTADLLKKKPYPGTVFAHRHRALEARPFQSSLLTTTTNYGFVWQYIDLKTPTSLQFTDTDVKLDPLGRDEETGRQKNTSLRFETAYNISEQNSFSLVYDHLSVSEEPYTLNYDSDELELSHRLDFGEGHRNRLDSELDYFNQRGTFSVERFRWRELLRMEHAENLRSRYTFELIDRTQGTLAGVDPIGERSYRVAASLEHELYESLVSQFEVYAQTQQFDSGLDIDRYGAYVNFDYRKKNRWGVLLAGYRFGIQRENRSGGDQNIEVLDERHTFVDPEPVTLSNTFVEESTIFVTAENRTTVYRVGRDYTIRNVGDRVELDRVPTGNIADGELVLIDYVFFVGGSFDLDTLTQNFHLRQDFDCGISPYYRLRWQDQSVSPAGAAGARAEDVTSQTIGVEYRMNSSLRFMAEYQDYDSNITPYRATRIGGDLTHRFKTGATGRVRARWSNVTYDPPNSRKTEFFTVEGRYRHPITNDFTVEAAALYRTEDDSISGTNDGVDFDLTLEWLVRQTEVRLTFEYGEFETQFAQNDNSAVYLQIKRSF